MFKFRKQVKARLAALEKEIVLLKKQLKEQSDLDVLTSAKKTYGSQGKSRRIIKKETNVA